MSGATGGPLTGLRATVGACNVRCALPSRTARWRRCRVPLGRCADARLGDRLLRLSLTSDEWLVLLGAVTAITGAAATIAAFKSASAARDAARETHKAVQAQLVTSLRDAYASGDMLTAIHTVRRWKRGEGVPPDSPMDHARRMISHHFQKIATLGRERLLDDDLLRVVAKANEVALFCQVIEPMEQRVSGHYDRSDFDLLANLYGGRDRLPPLAG